MLLYERSNKPVRQCALQPAASKSLVVSLERNVVTVIRVGGEWVAGQERSTGGALLEGKHLK